MCKRINKADMKEKIKRVNESVAQTRWDDESRGFKFPFTVEEVLKSMRIFKKPKYNFYVEIV